jgi:hypothetical protein
MSLNKIRVLAAIVALGLTTAVNAALLTFTDQAAFLAALPGAANTLDFDSQAAGTLIPSGSTIDGVTFNYDFGGVSLAVTDGAQYGGGGPFNTTSGTNFLGTNDADVLQDGDEFSLSFAPVNAIGMNFITAALADPMMDDDIILSAGGTSVGLNSLAAGTDLGDGGIPFFLGIINTSATFTTADISNIGGGYFLYNVDDITTAVSVVPIPGAIWLFASGLLGLIAANRKKA